ncbi:MAG: hypothetical protein ABF820_08580 [Sporolactobacillus sp.]
MIKQIKKCKVFIKSEWVEAEYVGVFQISDVIGESPMIGGHHGGVIAFPVVVAKVNDKLQQFALQKVRF